MEWTRVTQCVKAVQWSGQHATRSRYATPQRVAGIHADMHWRAWRAADVADALRQLGRGRDRGRLPVAEVASVKAERVAFSLTCVANTWGHRFIGLALQRTESIDWLVRAIAGRDAPAHRGCSCGKRALAEDGG